MESRSVVITSFDLDKEKLISCFKDLSVTYYVIGEEICPTTKRAHLQCYAQFGKKHTIKKIRKVLIGRDCRVPKGSVEECINYCKKDGAFLEEGQPRGLSKASAMKDRWKQIIDLAKKGSIQEIEEQYPSAAIIHRKTLQSIKDEFIVADHHPNRICVWIWGKSGIGKTRWAYDNFKPSEIFTLSDTDGWDLYNQERIAILDEADSSLGSSWKRLLRWADRYPVRARRLYGCTALNYEVLIITSMKNPCDIFNDEAIAAIKRRFIIVHALKYDCERQDLIIEDNQPFPLYLRNHLFKFNLFF